MAYMHPCSCLPTKLVHSDTIIERIEHLENMNKQYFTGRTSGAIAPNTKTIIKQVEVVKEVEIIKTEHVLIDHFDETLIDALYRWYCKRRGRKVEDNQFV